MSILFIHIITHTFDMLWQFVVLAEINLKMLYTQGDAIVAPLVHKYAKKLQVNKASKGAICVSGELDNGSYHC